MLRFIQMEFFKLKKTRTFIITIIGALLVPIINTVAQLSLKLGESIPSLIDMSTSSYLTFFSIILGVIIINYLFSIDIKTHTIKAIISLPVSKIKYLCGKLITMLLWMFLLCIITILASVILYSIIGLGGFDLGLLLKATGKFLLGTFLLYLTLMPFVFINVASRNNNVNLILAVLIIFTNMGNIFFDKLAYLPWNIPDPFINNTLTISPTIGLIIVILTGVIGYILTLTLIKRRDVPL